MSQACRRSIGTASRLLDSVAFGSHFVGQNCVPPTRLFQSASLANARDVLKTTSFDVGVGATLRVTAPRAWSGAPCPADVHVGVGDKYETIVVQASWIQDDKETASPPTVEAKQTADGDVQIVPTGDEKKGFGGKLKISCVIPPRFVGVAVASGGGSVHVEQVVEATVDVKSDGGDVTLGSIKGAAMRIKSGGGDVVGRSITADAAVDTDGGSVNFGKAVGRKIRIRTLGGALNVFAAYAHDVDVDTMGGDVDVGEIRVGQRGVVKTRGGALHTKGMAGNGDARILVDTGGGSCDVELRTEAAGVLHVHTEGGHCTVGVPDGFLAGVTVTGRFRGEDVMDFNEDLITADKDIAHESNSGFVNPFASATTEVTATTRMVGGTNDVAARKVAAAALASSVVLDTRSGSTTSVDDFFKGHPNDQFAYDGFDPFKDDDDGVLVTQVFDAAEEAVTGVDAPAGADATTDKQETKSGEIIVETRSWIASLGLGRNVGWGEDGK